MPLYEYECTACRKHTEKIQKFSDPEITACPFCGGKLERVISAPAIAFKGGGWYADGYGNAKPKSGADGNSNGSAEKSSGDSQSGDSKPDSKAKPGSESKSGGDSSSAPAPAASTPAPAPAAASSSSSSEKK